FESRATQGSALHHRSVLICNNRHSDREGQVPGCGAAKSKLGSCGREVWPKAHVSPIRPVRPPDHVSVRSRKAGVSSEVTLRPSSNTSRTEICSANCGVSLRR